MRLVKCILCTIVLAALSGCADPTIDASSDESLEQSVQKVREALPESRRSDFDDAIQVLAFSQIDMKELLAEGATGTGNLEGKVRQSLDGKTGEEVIAEAAVFKLKERNESASRH
jgi:hypothetical protein